jgi:hypothetical protein
MTSEIESYRASRRSELGTEFVSKDIAVEYCFHCFCGAPIVTTEKTVNCANCGKTIGIRRVKRQRWKIAPTEAPHRRLQLADLQPLGIRIFLCLLLGYYVYDLVDDLVQ